MSDKLLDPAWIKWSNVPADFIPNGAVIIGGSDKEKSMSDLTPIYFHEINDKQWETLKASGMTWDDAAKQFKPPSWCSESNAVDPMGCWSLVGRMVTGEDYCKNCELHQDNLRKPT